ncbi:MAG: zinc dependent phospholipase C family protein [Nanoarchaeota archaeon]
MKINTILITLCFFVYLPSAAAWGWNVHQNLAEKVYNSFQIDVQANLNLTLIKEGSIAPDKVFKNNRLHHYPPTYGLTKEWFDKAREAYENKDYNNASYAFGVMTHYISDSFVAPHYINGEDYKLHAQFENQVKNYELKTKCNKQKYDLNKSLYYGSIAAEKEWEPWLASRDSLIPKNEAERAVELLYSVSLDLFNTSCITPAKVEYSYFKLSKRFIVISAIISIIILFLLIDLLKD